MGREIAIVLAAAAALAPGPAAAASHHESAAYSPPFEWVTPADPLVPPPATNPGRALVWSDPDTADRRPCADRA